MLGHEFKAEEVTVALGMLVKKKVIETVRGEDDSEYITSRYGITTAGMEWLRDLLFQAQGRAETSTTGHR